jgi:prepilin-type N-terminal cleavage/methylation domain-containing protein/prepilin-type processing-associated H-X9-DG protein
MIKILENPMSPQSVYNSFGRRNGFTLIELLVVISIVSLLISILLPALAGARKAAQQITCATGAKQLAIGMLTYQDNNDLYFPSYDMFSHASGSGRFWFTNVDYYLTNDFSVLAGYDASAKIWLCPTDQTAGFGVHTLSYGYNSQLGYYRRDGTLHTNVLRSTELTHPSEKIMLGDGDPNPSGNYKSLIGWDALGSIPSDRHNDGANLSFSDGHVSHRKQVELIRNNGYSDANELNRLWKCDAQWR